MSETFFDTCVNWSCVTRCGCWTTSSTLFTVLYRLVFLKCRGFFFNPFPSACLVNSLVKNPQNMLLYIMYIVHGKGREEGGGWLCPMAFKKIHQYSDEKSAKLFTVQYTCRAYGITFWCANPRFREPRKATSKYSNILKIKTIFSSVYGAFRCAHHKNMGFSAITLMAERPTPRFFKIIQ